MTISEWHPSERPREKLLERGAEALSDAELLAIILRTGLPGRTAIDLARDLLTRFGSLKQLLNADQQSFCAEAGLGPAKYAQFRAVVEIGARYLAEEITHNQPLTSPTSAIDYLRMRLRGHQQEVFGCLFLDNRNRVLVFEELFYGTIDSAAVYPREIAKRGLQLNAAAVILAHNHPSGVAEPSASDQNITRQIRTALELLDIRLLDHVIVGDGVPTSMAERGLL
ncbi:MAG: DNA repair protein RadC [Gammaproteobacteria bacterium]|nr:DNA repair protein RadC [Gammaproteobacteria bacterium]